jgi:DNA-cytosine methyltransferase
MLVLSLFDGMSCGQIALKELGINIEKFYASEIDKYAIGVTQFNFPNTVQLGDITKWREWNLDLSKIDLILAGSPCQGFSIAGKMLNFEDDRSKLFFVFLDILNETKRLNPDVKFLLENVVMKKEWAEIISEKVGLRPVMINSALVSAQNRKRLYWSNIRIREEGFFRQKYTDIPQPADRHIFLKDILEKEVDEKYNVKGKELKFTMSDYFKKHSQIDGNKSLTMVARQYANWTGQYIQQLNPSTESNHRQPFQQNRIYADFGKSPAHMAGMTFKSYAIQHDDNIRRLTPTECARLQTIPDWYKWNCSETQIYKMLGNGWTVEVIKHILSFLNT